MKKRQHGLSIIEMMITILISSILILGVMQMFISTTDSSRANTALSRVQENGRVAIEMIAADARRTGYGCMPTEGNRQITIDGIQFPNQALSVTAGTSVTFRYGSVDAPLTNAAFIDSQNCQTVADDLRLNTVTYSNCANGVDLCLNNDPILANARITLTEVGIGNQWTNNPTSLQLSQARAIRITLRVSNQPRLSDNIITRDFTGTFSLRNRSL